MDYYGRKWKRPIRTVGPKQKDGWHHMGKKTRPHGMSKGLFPQTIGEPRNPIMPPNGQA